MVEAGDIGWAAQELMRVAVAEIGGEEVGDGYIKPIDFLVILT